MNSRNAPLSPVSIGDSDWPTNGYPMAKDDPYANPTQNNRGQLISPPNSGGSIAGSLPSPGPGPMSGMNFPNGPRSAGPSPPPSIGRSSVNSYARSETGRGPPPEITEIVLGEHYVALKRFLSQTSRDGKPNPPANKARDKLQRLTSVQFLELSTDVFDELIRRQAVSRRGNNGPQNGGPPAYLLPEDNFHPKRNQARQKLASLGPPRFRDLATDVFCELERRFPRFIDGDIPRMNSPASMRPQSRSQTPVSAGGMNGGFPPRGQSRRRPSEAGSVMSMRSGVGLSGLGPGIPGGGNSVPPSPGLPPNGYDRPLQKQLQSNTIVPNKSTMVEEDDDAVTSPMSDMPNGILNGIVADEAEKKKLIDDYEAQLKDLREKMEKMEQDMKRNQDELDAERSRSSSDSVEKQEWQATQRDLETQLQVALDLNDSLQRDMERARSEQSAEERQLRAQIDELRQSLADNSNNKSGANDAELMRENENLRQALREQQQVTDEVRGEAQGFLREMRLLSQQSGASYEKHAELEAKVETLEAEVREWRNRYARSKTQQRSMRASSMGVPIEEDAGRYVREQGFTTDSGLIKDVHVTKFQIAVDELLRRARTEAPERTVDYMKAVVVSVRRITKDLDDAITAQQQRQDDESAEQLTKLKTRVSGTANNLITAAKNYSMSAGLSPVSLLDAAASHLVASVVELLRTVKIRTTPANELDEDDEGSVTPVESNASFFSPRSNGQTPATTYSSASASATQNSLPPPPPFQGLGGIRDSVDSSAYSPINSPRESVDRFGGYANGRANGNGNGYGMNGMNGMKPAGLNLNGNTNGMNNFGPPSPVPGRADERTEDLKAMLDDQTATMVQIIQDMVGSIRSDAPVQQITGQINDITDIVGKVLAETEASGNGGSSLDKLASCRQRLVDAGERGEQMYASEASGGRKMDMRSWTTSLPPIAFEIARETKELVKRIDRLVLGDGEDFSTAHAPVWRRLVLHPLGPLLAHVAAARWALAEALQVKDEVAALVESEGRLPYLYPQDKAGSDCLGTSPLVHLRTVAAVVPPGLVLYELGPVLTLATLARGAHLKTLQLEAEMATARLARGLVTPKYPSIKLELKHLRSKTGHHNQQSPHLAKLVLRITCGVVHAHVSLRVSTALHR